MGTGWVGLDMARKDGAMFSAYREAIKHQGNFLEISTADFVQLVIGAGYAITAAEANIYITAQRQNVKIVTEGVHGFHLFRFTH
jgi:hypothetical protein